MTGYSYPLPSVASGTTGSAQPQPQPRREVVTRLAASFIFGGVTAGTDEPTGQELRRALDLANELRWLLGGVR